jgi:hypothetical protein
MSEERAPQLLYVARDTYRCADVPALHRWLEQHGYRYYGQHYPGEYGRFSCQEAHGADDRRYVHSYIQVFADGQIFAPDPHARELLAPLLADEGRERTV